MKLLYNETFEDFPIGEFPYDKEHSALGEYHHIMPEGYMGNFYDPINNHQWRSMGGNWLVTSYGGKKYMEQNRGYHVKGHFSDVTSMLVLNSEDIKNVHLETKITLYSTDYETGIAFNYTHNRKYLAFVMGSSYVELYQKNQTTRTTLKKLSFHTEALKTYHLKIERNEQQITIIINDEIIIQENFLIENKGKVALMSQNACRYEYLKVSVSKKEYESMVNEKEHQEKVLENKRNKFSHPEVIHKIKLEKSGSGRHIRVAKTKDNVIFVFAQHQKRMYRDAFAHISCLTAFDLSGKMLWQIGTPNDDPDYGLISCDLPFQIGDFNNDGKLELVYVRNFEIIVIDLLTGKEIKKGKTPYVKTEETMEKDYPYDYLNVDAIRFADFTKKGYRGDLMIKDRYRNVWGLDHNFNILFKYHHKNTGHFPYVLDIDQDGIDELFIGYDLTKNGKVIWSLPYNSDHTDEIIFESLSEDSEKVFILASGNEGFNIVSAKGEILHNIPVGHAQRISLAKYDPNKEGYQICVTSFWGANGIIYTFDKDLNLLAEKEMVGNGNIITPINYDNDDQNLILMNTSSTYGGLFDVNLDCVVSFKDEGQPTLASEAFDIDSDDVDEILTWDMNELWIYKASKLKSKKQSYRRYDEDSFSNYRGEYLLPKK